MSHTVTITRTTTSNTTSAIIINSGYLKTMPGLLKLAQLLLGIACVGVVGWYLPKNMVQTPELFFLLMAVACLTGTFALLVSCLCSLSTASIISKTLYEMVFHSLACLMYLVAGLVLLIEVNDRNQYRRGSREYEPFFAASIMGLIAAALYLFSAILASRSYRGI